MKEIPLTQGMVALVDDDDYEYLMHWKWHVGKSGRKDCPYAARSEPGKVTLMHIQLSQRHGKQFKDHQDRNGLNNQKSNLRPATRSLNAANKTIQKNNKSGFKGVRKLNNCERWQASVRKDRKVVWQSCFKTKIEAAKAYDQNALKHFGEYALTNSMMGLL